MVLGRAVVKAPTLVINSRQRAPLVELRGCGGAHGEPWGHGEASGRQTQRDIAGREELVRLQLVDGGPLGGIGVQHPLDERGRGRVDVLRRRQEIRGYEEERRASSCKNSNVFTSDLKERFCDTAVQLTQGIV